MSSKSEGRVELNSMMSMYLIYEGTKAPAENVAGLYGFIAKSTYQGLFPDTNSLGKEVAYQESRQIDNFPRRYYEKELGAGIAPSPGFSEMFGYTEPFRRFVQHETLDRKSTRLN